MDSSYFTQTGSISKEVDMTLSVPGLSNRKVQVQIGTAVKCYKGPNGEIFTDADNMWICSVQIPGLLPCEAGNNIQCVAFADQAYTQAAAEGYAKSILASYPFGSGCTLTGLDGLNNTPSLPTDLGG